MRDVSQGKNHVKVRASLDKLRLVYTRTHRHFEVRAPSSCSQSQLTHHMQAERLPMPARPPRAVAAPFNAAEVLALEDVAHPLEHEFPPLPSAVGAAPRSDPAAAAASRAFRESTPPASVNTPLSALPLSDSLSGSNSDLSPTPPASLRRSGSLPSVASFPALPLAPHTCPTPWKPVPRVGSSTPVTVAPPMSTGGSLFEMISVSQVCALSGCGLVFGLTVASSRIRSVLRPEVPNRPSVCAVGPRPQWTRSQSHPSHRTALPHLCLGRHRPPR
jgi:hypothetical protein